MYGVGLFLFLLTEMTLAEEFDTGTHLTIGVIAHGKRPDSRSQLLDYGDYNVTMMWNILDITEAFKVFTAVHRLDNDGSVDVIILFDFAPEAMPDPRVFDTQHTKLIKIGKSKVEVRLAQGKAGSHCCDTIITYTAGHPLYDPHAVIVVLQMDNTKATACFRQDLIRPAFTAYTQHRKDQPRSAKPVGSTIPHLDQEPYCKTNLDGSFMSLGNVSKSSLKQPIMRLLHSLKWTSIVIVHDNATSAEIQELTDVLSRGGVLFVLYNIDEIDDLHSVLTRIYKSTVKLLQEINFLVLGRPQCVVNILSIANKFDKEHTLQKTLMKQFSRWLVVVYGHTTEVATNVRTSAADLDNVVVIGVPEVNHPASNDLPAILNSLAKGVLKDDITNITKEYLVDKLIQIIKTWDHVSKCQGYNMDTLMWTSAGRGFTSVGYIDMAGNIVLHSSLFPNIDYGFNKREFIVSTLEWNPYVLRIKKNITDNVTGEVTGSITVGYEGFTMDLLYELARDLNFTYRIIEPADQSWGGIVIKHNYTFNGLVGQLQRQECDIVAAPLSITREREMVVDFSYPFYLEYTSVIVKRSDPKASKWRTLINPLKWEVLVTIGVALLLATVVICLLERYNPFYDTPEHGEERNINGGLHHLHNSFWYMYGCLLYQGGIHLPDSIAGRTFVSCWWLTCIIIVGIYSGNLIAFLTFRKEKPPFNTLEEMIEVPGLTWATIGSSVWSHAFLTSSIPKYRQIGDGLREFNKSDPGVLHPSLAYHINRVKQGGYAWIGDTTSIDFYTSTQCDLIKIKEEFLNNNNALAFPKGSPHTTLFSDQIMKLHESGLLQIWKRKWWPKSSFCAGDSVPEATPIMLIDVQSAFYVCVLATFIGTLAFITELIVFRIRRYKSKHAAAKKTVRCVSAEGIDTTL